MFWETPGFLLPSTDLAIWLASFGSRLRAHRTSCAPGATELPRLHRGPRAPVEPGELCDDGKVDGGVVVPVPVPVDGGGVGPVPGPVDGGRVVPVPVPVDGGVVAEELLAGELFVVGVLPLPPHPRVRVSRERNPAVKSGLMSRSFLEKKMSTRDVTTDL